MLAQGEIGTRWAVLWIGLFAVSLTSLLGLAGLWREDVRGSKGVAEGGARGGGRVRA